MKEVDDHGRRVPGIRIVHGQIQRRSQSRHRAKQRPYVVCLGATVEGICEGDDAADLLCGFPGCDVNPCFSGSAHWTPKSAQGNPFTDIYGLGANTKGFAEFKKFDYQRRKWLGGFQKDWVPAWSVSLKGMIAELTGMDVARQRLFCKGMAMGNDNLTLQSWNVTDGDTLQVRFQHKISQEQMEAVHKACQNAGHVERSVASINDPSLPVRAEMESSTSSDFWKPWMGRMKPAEKSQRSRSTRTPRDAKPVMLKDDSHTAQLRHSKHIRRCTSKSDVWMMPRWVSQDIPHHFAATGNPKHHVVSREPAPFAEQSIYLPRAMPR